MKLLRHLNALPLEYQGCVATIGNFDGLHRGHRQIIDHIKVKANRLQLPATVISFEPLPFEYFSPAKSKRIYPLRDKIHLLNQLNIQHFACLKFDKAMAEMAAEQFVQTVLLDHLQVRYLMVGDDFRFGYQRQGDFKLLKALGEHAGMQVVNLQTIVCGQQQRISSTRIREQLAQGALSAANQLLGQPYRLSGRIRHGDKQGRTIGFPTLNLHMPDNLALCRGVYAVTVHGLARKVLCGVANLGTRPTVGGKETRLEVHLFDFDQQVYGQHITVEPTHFIRAEQQFPSFPALKAQIKQDAEQARIIHASSL